MPRRLFARCALLAALLAGPFGCASSLPDPASLTPAERATACANILAAELAIEDAYGLDAALGDEAAQAALAAFRGQAAEYREHFGCQ